MKISEIENTAIQIRKVHVPTDDRHAVVAPLMDNNFATLVVGAPNSGKTTLLLSLLQNKEKRNGERCSYYKCFANVFFFSGSLQTLPDTFVDKLHPERVFQDLERLDEVIEKAKASAGKSVIILDDLVSQINEKRYTSIIMNLLYNRRHMGGGVSVMIVTQKLTKIPLSIRVACDSLYYFNLSNKRELNAVFDDFVVSLDRVEFDELVKYIVKGGAKHQFLYVRMPHGKFYKTFNEIVLE